PQFSISDNREFLLEQISGTVTAILGLVGMKNIDPIRSGEHILLANIFENAWSRGDDLTMGELIMQVQSPPFEKLGVFDINRFFPEKDRFQLAMNLNSILAAPAFQTWLEGQPLDIEDLLYTPDGQPRHSVFYIAHLSDSERMFFVSLLFSAFETWMRSKSGTTSLRALLYFDEIFGYLPPVGNPPSKEPMLRLLKQARAFGVGLVLASQNPVDIDYKALSNAGTWFIGKLQTDQDKQRLLDGLSGASGEIDRKTYDKLLSSLGKRVFLQHNVHDKAPKLFQTRWAMNYLAGPLTRTKIPELNKLAGITDEPEYQRPPSPGVRSVSERPRETKSSIESTEELSGSKTRPAVPKSASEYFLPLSLTYTAAAKSSGIRLATDSQLQGLLYRPTLIAQADIRFTNRKYRLSHLMGRMALVVEPDRRGLVDWDANLAKPIRSEDLDRRPAPDSRFASLEEPLSDAQTIKSLERDFKDWAFQTSEVAVKANEKLKIFAGPEMTEPEFMELCKHAATSMQEEEAAKVTISFQRKIDRVADKLKREERELREDEAEYSQRKKEEGVAHIETLIGLFGKRRRSLSSSMTKRRMTDKAKADVEESIEDIEEFEKELIELKEQLEEALEEISQKWEDVVTEASEIAVRPFKKDIMIDLFGVAWFPYHMVKMEGQVVELPGFAIEELN
ncbi:MAG: hypothetical protein JRJ19_09130, partial [Deltaproteobacteria bacterium]|nr:hypothetical protein [Deltaproteobacteria bacterium]